MIPTSFDYLRPSSLEEAIGHLEVHGDDAKILAGGHSLIPAMKFRLAQPKTVIDLGRITDLTYIRAQDEGIDIGAMTTHYNIESSLLLCERCPLLPQVAGQIGDVQVRNRGTIGGSLVHADPAADWPAAILALEAEMEIISAFGTRTVPASEFFVDLMQSAVRPNEILKNIRVPQTTETVAYAKFAQKASGFAIAGVAAVVDLENRTARVAINGVAAKAYRASAVEGLLQGQALTPDLIESAARRAAEGVDVLGDIHASAEFRVHLAYVQTKRALEMALGRAMD